MARRRAGCEPADVADFQSVTGKGVTGNTPASKLALGNAALMKDVGASVETFEARWMSCAASGRTVMFLCRRWRTRRRHRRRRSDQGTTPRALEALRADGLRIVMLTGDARGTAEAVAKSLGIDEVIAEVQPADKARIVERLQSEGRRVAMAGDGINDAPALARADVGIAMGTGTDIAMESAQVTLVKGDLNGIVRARQLEPRDSAQYLAEPRVRVRLQRARHSDRGGRAVSGDRAAAVTADRGARDEPVFSISHHQCAAAPRQIVPW